jgi:hypothetical protein
VIERSFAVASGHCANGEDQSSSAEAKIGDLQEIIQWEKHLLCFETTKYFSKITASRFFHIT